ncbi:MAG: toxin TcdB middle/N-terminal domain-containing protein, partial [Candidatus Methylomirabilaceae bacterium]
IHEVDPESLENLPYGLDSGRYQWIDLDGEGLSGVLTEQADGWFYKRNLSPLQAEGEKTLAPRFGPIERVAERPSLAAIGSGRQQFLDLAGDGQLDLVQLEAPTPGFYQRTHDEGWESFAPFTSLPVLDWNNPNLKFVDLTGDGHADILISEHEVFCWHPSLAEAGFAPPETVRKALDEEKGPSLVFADGTQSIYLADLSGDGLTDLVRIRNGEVCYWPNLGYGRFGAKVTMDNAPWFDRPDLFDQRRIRLADIDGSGVTDIIYLSADGVRLYFNQSGNDWSPARTLTAFPHVDNLSSVQAADLLGNGTACLVWSSPLPGDTRRPMRYIDLMGGQKPHLLIKSLNNLGAETHVHYAPSTQFYLQDKQNGKPWITRLPFPVHCVERVETYDRVSGNRFVTRYVYHHGYFDGVEREFRGFGMVEQRDTEEIAALNADQQFPVGTNVEESSHVPPVLTRTWFHTGVHLDRDHISDFFAGRLDDKDIGEYYREPGLTGAQARQLLLDDTVLPAGLTVVEEREACRAMKGSMLRQEVYALDGTEQEGHPYTVTEQNFTIQRVQPKAGNHYAVFFTHARESISYDYERNPADPRIAHALTLEVDEFANVLKSAAVGYGRRLPDMTLSAQDRAKQAEIFITYTENGVTNAIEAADDYRTPLPCEARTFELTALTLPTDQSRFTLAEMLTAGTGAVPIAYEQSATSGVVQKRLIEHVRTLYRRNDLTGALPLGELQSLALPFESYRLAFSPGLAKQVYVDSGKLSQADLNSVLANDGKYVHSEGDANWWIASGRTFFSPASTDTSAQELAYTRQHFFLPHRYRDPFHTNAVSTESFVSYDAYDLLMLETRNALGNVVTVATKDDTGNTAIRIDYRVLQPYWVTDPNGNRTAVAFDTLGMVVGTAVMGKPLPAPVEGDSLDGFEADLTEAVILDHLANPLADPQAILRRATTRLVYDLFAYHRTKDQVNPQPAVVYTLLRETHDADLESGEQTKVQHSFSYSDGFGREIQKTIQAEPGPVPTRDATGKIIVGPDGQPMMTPNDVSPRWVGSGWTVFNNKGKPVRQYEPFFTDTHRFELDVRIGVSPVLLYDP